MPWSQPKASSARRRTSWCAGKRCDPDFGSGRHPVGDLVFEEVDDLDNAHAQSSTSSALEEGGGRRRHHRHRKEQSQESEQSKEKDEEKPERQDFSYLKENLLVDVSQDQEGEEGRKKQLETIEEIMRDAQLRVRQLEQEAAEKAEQDADPGGKSASPRRSGRQPQADAKEEIRRLKRCVRELGCMLAHLRQKRRPPMTARGKGAAGGSGPNCQCNIDHACPHTGRGLEGARDRLADLRNLYEHSLLITPDDVNWPFVHLIDSNRQPSLANEGGPCCG